MEKHLVTCCSTPFFEEYIDEINEQNISHLENIGDIELVV